MRERFKKLIKALPFLSINSYLLLLNIASSGLMGALVKSASGGRKAVIIKSFRLPMAEPGKNIFTPELKKIVTSLEHVGKVPALVSLSSRFATTVQAPISLMRQSHNTPVAEPELDELVYQGVWRVFDRERDAAAGKLNLPSSNLTLADAHISSLKLDGHRVVNPLDFAARLIELSCRETLVEKSFSEGLQNLLVEKPVGFIEEDGAVFAELIRRSGEDSFLLMTIGEEETRFFKQAGQIFRYQNSYGWGFKNILLTIRKALGVAELEASQILNRLLNKQASVGFIKKLEQLIIEEFSVLFKAALAHAGEDARLPLYFYSERRLPDTVMSQAVGRRFGFRGEVKIFNEKFIGEKYNFELPYNQGDLKPAEVFKILASLVYFQTIENGDLVSRIVKRRVRWLQAGSR